MARLIHVTFTGLDEHTDLDRALRLQQEHPLIEYGVLVAKSRTGKEPRYPSREFLEEIASCNFNLSVHMCGSIAREAVRGNFAPAEEILGPLAYKANRIQLNISTYTDNPARVEFTPPWNVKEIILQQKSIYDCQLYERSLPNNALSVLIDASGGRGLDTPLTILPTVRKTGYAGGIGPENIREKLTAILSNPLVGEFWVDMESRIRTNDMLDLDKVLEVILMAKKTIKM